MLVRIAETTLPNGIWVSTIKTDLRRFDVEEPYYYETRVFPARGILDDLECVLYHTAIAAIRGHARLVEQWSSPDRSEPVQSERH